MISRITLSFFISHIHLDTLPVGKVPVLNTKGYVAGAVSFPAVPVIGFNKNGAGELSGNGSTEITTFLPRISKGNTKPFGVLLKKSSPGISGPTFSVPLKEVATPALSSTVSNVVKVPVDKGPTPSTTTHPSYFHPGSSVGNVSAGNGGAPGVPNQIPLSSFPLFRAPTASSVGVLKKNVPAGVKAPKSATVPIEIGAESPEKSPATNFVSEGAAAAASRLSWLAQ